MTESAEIWYGGGNLAVICAYQISAKLATKKFLRNYLVFVVAFKTSDERSPLLNLKRGPWDPQCVVFIMTAAFISLIDCSFSYL